MDKLRWGILGVAKINERVVPAFHAAANAELRAIASRSLERARAAAAAGGITAAYGNYDELLDDPELDAVYIPLPNHMHAEWTMKAADHGKHVLCEKPLAVDAAEARRMVDHCRAQNVALMDGTMWPHHPRTAKLREFLDCGGIGAVRRVTTAFSFHLGVDPKNIRLQEEMAGGSLMDIGWYTVYGARWALGTEPTRVMAAGELRDGVDLSANAVLEFPGGAYAVMDCGFTLPLRTYLEIAGTEGSVWVPDMWLPGPRAVFQVYDKEGRLAKEIAVEGEDQIVHLIENFGRAVREWRPPTPSPEQAVANMRVLDALRLSVHEQRAVDVRS